MPTPIRYGSLGASRLLADTGVAGITRHRVSQYLASLMARRSRTPTAARRATYLSGNEVANILNGNGGNDVLSGFTATTRSSAATGNDDLTGGAGNDTFVLRTRYEIRATLHHRLSHAAATRIDLRGIDCQPAGRQCAGVTPFIGGRRRFSQRRAGQLRQYRSALTLSGDIRHGDGIADFSGDAGATPSTGARPASDFFL